MSRELADALGESINAILDEEGPKFSVMIPIRIMSDVGLSVDTVEYCDWLLKNNFRQTGFKQQDGEKHVKIIRQPIATC